jgi:hypothetical protein
LPSNVCIAQSLHHEGYLHAPGRTNTAKADRKGGRGIARNAHIPYLGSILQPDILHETDARLFLCSRHIHRIP